MLKPYPLYFSELKATMPKLIEGGRTTGVWMEDT